MVTAHGGCRWGLLRDTTVGLGRATPANHAEEQGKKDETAHPNADTDDKVLVILDPASDRRTTALAGFAGSARFTRRPIEIVLVHLDTGTIGIFFE